MFEIRAEDILKENERRKAANAAATVKITERTPDDAVRIREDFGYWAATRAYIKSKTEGIDVPFLLNRAQRKLVTVLEDMRRKGEPIRLILLKARQWGGSTCVQLYMAWLQLIHQEGLNSLILAHQGCATDEIKDMLDRMIKNYPDADGARPGEEGSKVWTMKRVGRSGSIFRIEERGCKVKIGSAERPEACRGGDYSLVHCSEVGMWRTTAGKSPEMLVRAACSGVLLKPMTMIVFESTANGTGNYFHREYMAARRGESQFRALFVAWYEIDQYSKPLADAKKFAEMLIRGRDIETSSSERRQPGRYLWWLWERGATLEAINWYISERMKYSDHGQMASEYPSDDVEAFVHSGARVFDRYKVEALRAGCHVPAERGDIRVPDATLRPNAAMKDSRKIEMLGKVGFMPLESGEWKVWKHPENYGYGALRYRNRYLVSVDVGGRSVKSDWSVIVVFDRLPMRSGDGPEVVAQWRGHSDFDLLAWRSALAAQYYHKALLVIESNTLETRDPERSTDGDQSCFLLERLRRVYPNLYTRPGSPEDVLRGLPYRYGFHTNSATKPMVIASLVEIIRDGLYTERDEDCLDEYLQYERRQNGSYGAIQGRHDDLLMTRAIGLHVCFNDMDELITEVAYDGGNHPDSLRGYGNW